MGSLCPRPSPEGISQGHVGGGGSHGDTTAGPAPTSGKKRAARPIPARRQSQATHGTYRGGIVFQTGRPWPPSGRPADGGPPHHRPVGFSCLGESQSDPLPIRDHRGATETPRGHEREKKRAARLIPARRQPQATHGTYRGGVVDRAGGPSSGKKARRPTDPRETAAPGHPRYLCGEEGQRREKREGGRDSGPGSPERIRPRTAPNHGWCHEQASPCWR